MKRLGMAGLLLVLASAIHAENVHVVQPGETLSGIAQRTLGSPLRYPVLVRLNNLPNANAIRIGQRLRLPDSALVSSTATRPSAPGSATASSQDASTAPEDQELAVVDLSGTLELIRGGVSVEISSGSRLRAGDSLRTSSSGRALLAGMNGERLELGASATVLIRELSATLADRRIVLRVDAGELHLAAPETPFLTRYLLELPTGSVSTRFGDLLLRVSPPDVSLVSVFAGTATVAVPRGSRELRAGQGGVFRTTDLAPLPASLPSVPGVSIETTQRSAIVAAATLPGNAIRIDVYQDRDRQHRIATRRIPADDLGLAVARIELGAGTWWILTRAEDRSGLTGPPSISDPVTLAGH